MSTRLQWTWNGAVLRTRAAARTFPTMWCARNVELVILASADHVAVGSTTPHSRMAWRPPKSPSLISWLIPITHLKSGRWMECPSITLARISQCLSPWQPTKQVGSRSTLLYDLNVHSIEKGLVLISMNDIKVPQLKVELHGPNYKPVSCVIIQKTLRWTFIHSKNKFVDINCITYPVLGGRD